MSTSAHAAGLGSSAAVSVHVLRVLPDPGPGGKSLIHHRVLHRSLSGNILRAVLCDGCRCFGVKRLHAINCLAARVVA